MSGYGRSGPAPTMTGRNRAREKGEWKRLPAVCELPPPQWPEIFGDPSDKQLTKWASMWRMPQAFIWHEQGLADIVATYVLALAQVADYGESVPPRFISPLLQISKQLAMDPAVLRGMRYIIEGTADEVVLLASVAAIPQAKTGTDDVDAIKSRFKRRTPTDGPSGD